jgi:TatD DNase family protein
MGLIDTHAHLYSDEFDTDRDTAIIRAREKGVKTILMPAIDSGTHHSMLELEKKHPGFCVAMMGLHPCSVKENYMDELKLIEEYLGKRKFIAIGETGLDYYWDLSFKDQQLEAFNRQCEWARQVGVPIVIHSRNSTDECIDVIKKHQDGSFKGVFHCFSGTAEQARKVVELGFYLGIGGVLTFKNAGLDQAIRDIDLSSIVLETDAPYLAPVPFRGKRNEPAYINNIAEKLASIKNSTLEEITSITTANAEELFGL